ncbi:MAG: hydrazine oxidoreductase HzoA, partial [Candidatus Brocadia sp. BL1]
MHKFLKLTLASALLGCGAMGVVGNLMTKEAKAVEIITHWVPHEVYGQIGEPDNNGKVFFSGLGAKYMG